MQQKILDNRYELERKIGEGGMACVYVGRDLRLNRRVAVKVLHSQYNDDADFLSRFRHEALAAAILSHPNVVDVYDVGQDHGVYYIVMEYVDGIDLKALIMREAPLPIGRAVTIAEAIAHGLEAAHQRGLVHRDVKPQNIIISPDGYVRITDFGIAKSHLSTALTETGVTFGTVDYISPEQAQGKLATPCSDVYALGVTLYEMLTGRLPFSGDNAVAIAMQHVSTPPPPLRQFNPLIPSQLEAVALRALSKNPAQRPQSAQEFAQLLRGYRDMSRQETTYNASLSPPVAVETLPPRSVVSVPTGGTAHSNRMIMPPPRSVAARTPRRTDQGLGCGVFFVGLLVVVGVLGLVALFSSGILENLFSGIGISAQSRTPSTPPATSVTKTPFPLLVVVPSLINLTENDAQRILEEHQLLSATNTAKYDPNIAKGRVIEQEALPGSQLAQGSPVTYTLSLGPEVVTVPELRQRRFELAEQQARKLGLVVQIVREPSREITDGFVMRQSPAPNLLVQPNDTITLFVSAGDKVHFPNIIGMSRNDAENVLHNSDDIILEYSDLQGRDRLIDFDTFFPGEVVSASFHTGDKNYQTIKNGELLPRGSRIILGVRAEE